MAKIQFKSFEPIPAGTYRFRVKGCEERESTNKQYGDSYLLWEFEVLQNPEFATKTISLNTGFSFGPQSVAYSLLRACGMADLTKDAELDTLHFLGREFYAQVTVELNTKQNPVNKFKTFWSEAEFATIASSAAGVVAPAATVVAPPVAAPAAPIAPPVAPAAPVTPVTPAPVPAAPVPPAPVAAAPAPVTPAPAPVAPAPAAPVAPAPAPAAPVAPAPAAPVAPVAPAAPAPAAPLATTPPPPAAEAPVTPEVPKANLDFPD